MRLELHGTGTHGTDDLDLTWAALPRPTMLHQFGSGTVARGEGYARQGAVQQLSLRDGGHRVVADVRGSGRRTYVTTVAPQRSGGGPRGVHSACSCPMAAACKHVVAVLVTLAETRLGAPAPGAAWEATLASLVAPSDGDRQEGQPLALAVEVVAPRGAPHATTTVPRLRMRPVAPGANGNWVRTGASWRDLEYGYHRGTHRTAHREALLELLRTARSRLAVYAYSSNEASVHLDDLGPQAWNQLHALRQRGVELVQLGKAAGAVRVQADPVQLVVDARRRPDDGAVTLWPVLRTGAGDQISATDGAVLTGDPAHGLWWRTGTDLVLAPLAGPMPAASRAWFEQGNHLDVPASDVPRLLATYYPALARRLPVESSDDSLVVPEVHPVRLGLAVTFSPGHVVDLAWSLRYQVGDDVTTVPVHPEPGGPPGDRAAEATLVNGLDVLDGVPGLRIEVGGEHRLVPQNRLSGWKTATFVEQILPVLASRDDVEVTVAGEPAEYHEVHETPSVEMSVTDAEGSTDWFDLAVVVRVGGRAVPFEPLFAALARGDEQMLLDDGAWFRLDHAELHQLRGLIEASRDLVDAEPGVLRVTVQQAGLWEQLVSLGVVTEQSERWARTAGALLDLEKIPAPDDPVGLHADLRSYQREGYQWLTLLWDLGLGGVLADDMGLGKTVQTLAMVQRAKEEGALTQPVLVVAPTSVVATWRSEAEKFTPGLRVVTVTETERRRGVPLAELMAASDVVVTSYALLRIDDAAYLGVPWGGLVLDEAQFVKNHRTATYQCARRVRAPFKLAITGTPLENSLMDLWSLLSIVAPGLFADPQHFSETYRRPIERGGAPELLGSLRRRIRPLMMRRTKEQVAPELPPRQEQLLTIGLNPAHRRVYQTHLQRERQRVLGMVGDLQKNRIAILRSLTLLRQLSLDPSLVDDRHAGHIRSSKVDALLEHLEEVAAEGHRALVFSQFTGFLKIVRGALDDAGIGYSYLDGRTRDRPRRVAEFTEGDAPVFLISLKAGGFGLNLTEADYVFILDPWWNPATEAQAVDRTHRIGQDKTVMVYRLVSADTIEEKVVALQQRKRDLFTTVVGDGDALSGPLSVDDIRALLG